MPSPRVYQLATLEYLKNSRNLELQRSSTRWNWIISRNTRLIVKDWTMSGGTREQEDTLLVEEILAYGEVEVEGGGEKQ